MVRRRGISDEEQANATVLIEQGPGAGGDPGDAAEQWDEFEKFRDEGEGSTAGMHVWVYRIPTDAVGNPLSNVDSALLFTAPIDVYTLPQIYDRVKKEYMARGIGRSLIRIQVRREKVRGVLWQKMVPIEKGLRDDEAQPQASGSDANIPALNAIAQMVQQQSQLIARLFEAQRNVPALPPRDPFAESERIITMVTGLAGVLSKPAAAGPAANSMADMLSAFREIKKLSREMSDDAPRGGDDAGGENIAGILNAGKPVIELLTALVQRSPAQPVAGVRRLPPAQRPTLPNPNAAGSASVTPPVASAPTVNTTTMGSAAVTPQGTDPMLLEFAKKVSDICDLIEAGKAEPEGLARIVLDAVPADQDDKFYAIVADEYWLVKLAAVEPRVNNHKEFFGKMREIILQEFTESDMPPAIGG